MTIEAGRTSSLDVVLDVDTGLDAGAGQLLIRGDAMTRARSSGSSRSSRSSRPRARVRGLAAAVLAGLAIAPAIVASAPSEALAFSHVVKQGEQLVQISVAMYGSPRFETVLVAANGLDAHGGSLVVAGMPLEVPAPGHHVVESGETWGEIAARTLGDAKRADVLARANNAVPWVQPSPGQEIEVPAIVAYLADGTETMSTLAQRFYGNLNRSWELNQYNGRQGDKVSAARCARAVARAHLDGRKRGRAPPPARRHRGCRLRARSAARGGGRAPAAARRRARGAA